jgi:hypothetical protein
MRQILHSILPPKVPNYLMTDTMSQKSSLPHSTDSVQRALTPDSPSRGTGLVQSSSERPELNLVELPVLMPVVRFPLTLMRKRELPLALWLAGVPY